MCAAFSLDSACHLPSEYRSASVGQQIRARLIESGTWPILRNSRRVGLIPLFCGVVGDSSYVSDEAEWMRQKVGDREIDEVATQEFPLTRYVVGADTLFGKVKQVQAGEGVHFQAAGDEQRVSLNRWYRFLSSS